MAPKFALWSEGRVDAAGASEILNKALLGERESLAQLGLKISEADVQAQILKNTQNGLTFETEKQAKAQATLDLILAGSTDAMAFYGTEAGQAALALEQNGAKIDELKEKAALALLPVRDLGVEGIVAVTDAIIGAGSLITEYKDEIVLLGVAAGTIITARTLAKLGSAIGNLILDLRTRPGGAGGGLAGAIGKLASPANLATLALAGLAVGITAYIKGKKEQKQRIDDVVSALSDETGTIEDNTAALIDNTFANSDLGGDLLDLGLTYNDLELAMNGNVSALDKVRLSYDGAGKAQLPVIAQIEALIEGSREHADRLAIETINQGLLTNAEADAILSKHTLADGTLRAKDASAELQAVLDLEGDSVRNVGEKTGEMAEAMADAETETVDLESAVDDLRGAIDELFGSTQGVDAATLDYIDSAQDLTESLSEQREESGNLTNDWNILTEAGRENIEAAREAASSIRDLGLAELEAGHSIDEVTGKTRARNDALFDELVAAGMTEGAARELIETYGSVPEDVATELTADTSQAHAQVSALNDELFKYNGKTYTAYARVVAQSVAAGPAATNQPSTSTQPSFGSSGNIYNDYYASGGVANSPSVFGEAGPELAVPLGRGGQATADRRRVLEQHGHRLDDDRPGGVSFGDINVTVTGQAEPMRIGREIAREVKKEIDRLEGSNA